MVSDFKTRLINSAYDLENAIKDSELNSQIFLQAFNKFAEMTRRYLSLCEVDEKKIEPSTMAELETDLNNLLIDVWRAVANDRLAKVDNSLKIAFHKLIGKTDSKQLHNNLEKLRNELNDNLKTLSSDEKIKHLKEVVSISNQLLEKPLLDANSIAVLMLILTALGLIIGIISFFIQNRPLGINPVTPTG